MEVFSLRIRTFFRYVSLNILGMLGLSCYILVDTLFVSLAEGAGGLAALNLAITVYSVIIGLGQMAGVGGGTDYAFRRAEGQSGNASFSAALAIGAVLSGIFFFCGLFFVRPISLLLGADSITLPLTSVYIHVMLLFAPCFILNVILQAFARNDGVPRLAMYSMLLSSGANIVLDYLFMFPLKLGMFGAAFATGLSALMSILLLLSHFRSKRCTLRFSAHIPPPHALARLLSYGLSALIGELASAISLLTFNLLLMRAGGYIAVAAYGVIANAALVASSIFTGVGQGLQPLASHAYGAADRSALRTLRRCTLASVLALSAVIFLGVFVFARPIAALFNHEGSAALAAIAVPGLQLYFAGYLFAGINIAAAAYLSATSRPVLALWISLLRSCLLLIPAALVISRLLGITGIWLSFAITEAAVCLLSLPALLRGKPMA